MATRRLHQTFDEVQEILDAVDGKVDKETGKGLSTNDYTDADKDKTLRGEFGYEAWRQWNDNAIVFSHKGITYTGERDRSESFEMESPAGAVGDFEVFSLDKMLSPVSGYGTYEVMLLRRLRIPEGSDGNISVSNGIYYVNRVAKAVALGVNATQIRPLADMTQDSTHRLVTDQEKADWNTNPDWEEADPGSAAYIRNRTHWEEDTSSPATLTWDDVREGEPFYLNYGDVTVLIQHASPNTWEDGDGRWVINWDESSTRPTTLMLQDYDSVYPMVTFNFLPGRTAQPRDLGFSIGGITVHKLDNKYLDLDSSPTEDSPKPVTSGGVYEALTGKASIRSGSTLYWNSVTYVPKSGEVIIYTDKAQKDGVYIPGVKIGTGNAYVQDLPFIDDAVADSLVTHINDTNMHITSEERSRWDNKLNVDDDYAVVNKTLIFNRN